MGTAKERMKEVIEAQPDDSTYEAILRELAFARMIDRGLEDSRAGRTVSDEEMQRRIRAWQKQNKIAYLVKGKEQIDILGVFHGGLEMIDT
jgi:predicted transcriptional regulator